MNTEKISKFIRIDYVNSDNGWRLIYEKIKDIDEPTIIDMTALQISATYECHHFLKIIELENIYLIIKGDESLINTLKIFIAMDGIPADKIIFEERLPPPVRDKNAEQIEKKSELMRKIFHNNGNINVAKFSDTYTQMSTSFIADIMKRSIEKVAEETGVKKFDLDFTGITVENATLNRIADLLTELIKDGYIINVTSDNTAQQNEFDVAFNNSATRSMTIKDKIKIVRQMLDGRGPIPGIFIMYRISKSTDSLGRSGNGEPIMVRIATLDYIDNQGMMKFTTYNKDTFYTKIQWAIENDGEELEKLDTKEFSQSVDSFGFMNFFMGSCGHFIRATRQSPEETTNVIYDITEDGKCVKQTCSIAERMKIVFDSWGVEYDSEIMEESIREAEQYKFKK